MFLVIPIYSFWHMDDFGWGSTRLVQQEVASTFTPSHDGTLQRSKHAPLSKTEGKRPSRMEKSLLSDQLSDNSSISPAASGVRGDESDSALMSALKNTDDVTDDKKEMSYQTMKTLALLERLKEKEHLMTETKYAHKRQVLFEEGIRKAAKSKIGVTRAFIAA